MNDTAPLSRWAYDILESEGEEHFRQLVEEIKIKLRSFDSSITYCM